MSPTMDQPSDVRAALYARKSTEDKARPGKSVGDQLREARAEVDARGFSLSDAHVFEDDGVSASRFGRGKGRPGFSALIAALESREIDVLFMAEQSRSARRMSVIGTLVELCADNGQTMVIGGRAVDPTDPADLAVIGMQAGLDAGESERTSQRSRRGARSTALAGKPAGKNMYGYARTYDPATRQLLAVEPVEREAAIVREIVKRVLLGESLREIAFDLNRRGEASPYDAVAARCGRESRGASWQSTQVRRVALSPAYAGLRVHRGKLTSAVWPAIVTASEHDRVTAILVDAGRRTNASARPGAVRHWLSGLVKCGACGAAMRVLVNRRTYRHYVCPACHGTSKTAGPLEGYVEAFIFELVKRPDTLSAIAAGSNTAPSREALERLEAVTARRESVRALVVSGAMPAEDGAVMLSALAGEIESAERAVRSVVLPRSLTDVVTADLEDRWEAFSPARKREVANALVNVTVLPMNGRRAHVFDPTSVSVTPKGAAQ